MTPSAFVLGASAGLVLVGILVGAVEARRSRRRLARRLRASWGRIGPIRSLDDHAESQAWLMLDSAAPGPGSIDDGTWSDLDLDSLVATLDRTRTGLGRQILYRRIRSGAGWLESPVLEPLARRFSEDAELRDTLGIRLESAGRGLGPGLWILTRPDLIRTRWWYGSFPILALAMLVTLVVIPFEPRALLVALPLAVVNMSVSAWITPRLGQALPPIRQLGPLLRTGTSLVRMSGGRLPGAGAIAAEMDRLRTLGFVAWWVSRDPLTAGELAAGLWAYLNLMFILDANALILSARELKRHASAVVRTGEWIGAVDLARSVASLRAEPRSWCIPQPSAGPTEMIHGTGLWHPLIEDPTPNDVAIAAGRGIVVTGANMSGKSTYLRSVGIAAILARALNTCPAASWSGPPLRVRSLMTRSDDLAAGKSYYQVEVDRVVAHLREAREPIATLFLLDELLRGTNTVERLAAGEAVLRALLEETSGQPSAHRVMVATHDGEMVSMLEGLYDPWHFRETITPAGLDFDHRRLPGPATSRTAIALLEVSGAPAAVVSAARARAARNDRDPAGSARE